MLASQISTRVARRILLLFLIATLLPTATALLVADTRIRGQLVEQSLRSLRQTAEAFALRVFDRLILAQGDLDASTDAGTLFPARLPSVRFSAAGLIRPDRAPQMLSGAPPDPSVARSILGAVAEPGATRIVTLGSPSGPPGVWLVRAGPEPAGASAYALRLDATHLWGEGDDLPYLTDICVLDSRFEPLYCSATLGDEVVARIRASRAGTAAGSIEWAAEGERRLSVYREIFLTGQFGAPGWTVVVTQPASFAFAPTAALWDALIPAVVLSVLLAGLIGLWQVRKTLTPLRHLTLAARRVGLRDFHAQVSIARDDEFGELADAFNTMSTRLGSQFEALRTLAQIDREILAGAAPAAMARACLSIIHRGSPTNPAALMLAEDQPGARHFTVWRAGPGGDNTSTRSANPDAGALDALSESRHGEIVDARVARSLGLETLLAAPSMRLFVRPISDDERTTGLIALGLRDDEALDPALGATIDDLASRIAVAMTAARRREQLQLRAMFDPLTGLPNRVHVLERLEQEVARARSGEHALALLFVDLDGFSSVNDSLGHAAGDELLTSASARLRQRICYDDFVGRLGGDEFVLLLRDVPDRAGARSVAQRIVGALSDPFHVAGSEVFIAASVGIAFAPEDATSADDLLRAADLALYQAKSLSRGTITCFEPAMSQQVERRVQLDRELREALARDEFELHYEPLVETASGRVYGAEALIRWRHPKRGMVPPLDFIGVAEDTGLIVPIGDWVLRTACAQFMQWRTAGLGLETISVNVSPQQFRRPDFVQRVTAVISDSAMDAGALQLEITENLLIEEQGEVGPALRQLAALGIELALDDFGTGYSSLSYLKRLPVGTIKIDRAFVREIHFSADAGAVARAAIEMAHALGKRVVAEGVEIAAQRALLTGWGCDLLQGWLFTRSLPAAQFDTFVRAMSGAAAQDPGSAGNARSGADAEAARAGAPGEPAAISP